MMSLAETTFTKHDIDPSNGRSNKIASKIKKTNFHFGDNKSSIIQTTNQYNNSITERMRENRGKQKPLLDRRQLNNTQFVMGTLIISKSLF